MTSEVKKIAVLGAESTGKTWLCEQLAAHYKTVWVREYAREYFNDSDIYNYTLNDLEKIARRQMEMEDEAERNAQGFLFCDTTLVTLKIWAELEFQVCPSFIAENVTKRHYDLYLITANDIAWMADPLRQNKHSRDLLMELNIEVVKRQGASYRIIRGEEEERLMFAKKQIETFFDFR